jgi:hypothetical protein
MNVDFGDVFYSEKNRRRNIVESCKHLNECENDNQSRESHIGSIDTPRVQCCQAEFFRDTFFIRHYLLEFEQRNDIHYTHRYDENYRLEKG